MEKLRQHQRDAVERIVQILKRYPAFLLADDVGLGKTRTSIAVAQSMQLSKVLIVAPLSTWSGWNWESMEMLASISLYPKHGPTQFTWINYDKLINDQVFQNSGWQMVIWDEAHKLKNPNSQRTKAYFRMREKCAKHLFLTATPGQSPLEMKYLCDVAGFSQYAYWDWCKKFKGVWKPKWGGFKYSPNINDVKKLEGIVKDNPYALARRPSEIIGWPEIQREMYRFELSEQGKLCYEKAFLDWKEESGKHPPKSMEQLIAAGQFRKRISELKAPYTANLAMEMMENGKVATIACEYLTPAYEIMQIITDMNVNARVAIIDGSTSAAEREVILSCSKRDELDAIIFTVQEGINLQQFSDSHRERVQIDHDVRWSALQQIQVDGRTHRAGRSALVYWMCCLSTIDKRVIATVHSRMDTVKTITGDVSGTELLSLIL